MVMDVGRSRAWRFHSVDPYLCFLLSLSFSLRFPLSSLFKACFQNEHMEPNTGKRLLVMENTPACIQTENSLHNLDKGGWNEAALAQTFHYM